MRKVLIVGMALGAGMMAARSAHADPVTDWLMSLLGLGSASAGGAQTNGLGDGTGAHS